MAKTAQVGGRWWAANRAKREDDSLMPQVELVFVRIQGRATSGSKRLGCWKLCQTLVQDSLAFTAVFLSLSLSLSLSLFVGLWVHVCLSNCSDSPGAKRTPRCRQLQLRDGGAEASWPLGEGAASAAASALSTNSAQNLDICDEPSSAEQEWSDCCAQLFASLLGSGCRRESIGPCW